MVEKLVEEEEMIAILPIVAGCGYCECTSRAASIVCTSSCIKAGPSAAGSSDGSSLSSLSLLLLWRCGV